ncbi:MAG: pentapeptide repeat-containing protein [Cyanobacteria bacterium P01_F01_bin.13]
MSDDLRNKLIQDFEQLSKIRKPFDREYEKIRRAKQFEADYGLTSEQYERLFELYLTDIHVPDWLERTASLTQRLQLISQTLQSFAFLAIFLSAIQFLYGFRERQASVIAEKWAIVASDVRVGSSKREAIEYLHDQGELLSNIEAIDTQLSGLNLPNKARLQEAKFQGANLYQAYFRGANLYRSDFSNYDTERTNLEAVNFQDADLRQANFSKVNLKNSCFRGANLEEANFKDAYLVGVDFRGARFLTAEQITRNSNKTFYERAIFDDDLARALGQPTTAVEPAVGCQIQPRKHGWWQGFLGG